MNPKKKGNRWSKGICDKCKKEKEVCKIIEKIKLCKECQIVREI